MVINDNSQNFGSDDDMAITSPRNDVINVLHSTPNVHCPHCDFRCTSPSIMTQHSWEVHPLLMRQKKHLITSCMTSSTESQAPLRTTVAELKNCSLSSDDTRMEEQHHETDSTEKKEREGAEPVAMPFVQRDAARSLSLLSSAAAYLDAASEYSPQRHVAVVKPVPTHRQETGAQPVIVPQQISANNPFVYAPMYNAYIPSLNQFVTIPIAPGVFPTALPTSSLLNTSIENALKNYLDTQRTQTAELLASMPQPMNYVQTSNQGGKQQQSIVTSQNGTLQNGLHTNQKLEPNANEIRNLLQANNIGHKMEPTVHPQLMSHNAHPVKIEQSDMSLPPLPPGATLDKERQREIENALLSTDCCDINDSSTTMPFKCPDGVWRMVKFKCIRGVWLVQVPGMSTPTVYVPCDADKVSEKSNSQDRNKSVKLGHKRKLSDSITSCGVSEVKRLCASAPIPGAPAGTVTGKVHPLQRTRSDPALPAPRRHFINNEGKTVNISMIKRNPPQNKSCNLIKSLLLRKPVTQNNVTSSLTSSVGGMQCKPTSAQKLVSSLNRPAPLSTNSMVY